MDSQAQELKQRFKDTDSKDAVTNENDETMSTKNKKVAMAKRGIRSLVVAIALPLSLTLFTSCFLGPSSDQYGSVSKPFWFPPLWILHVTSLVSSFLMGLSAWLVWAQGGFHKNPKCLYLYMAQLVLSLAWYPVVFKAGVSLVGLIVCLGMFGALFGCCRQFKTVNPTAGDLVKPCLAWAAFLLVVNLKFVFA